MMDIKANKLIWYKSIEVSFETFRKDHQVLLTNNTTEDPEQRAFQGNNELLSVLLQGKNHIQHIIPSTNSKQKIIFKVLTNTTFVEFSHVVGLLMKSQPLEKLSINDLVKFTLPRMIAIERPNLPLPHNKYICMHHFK